MAQSLQYNSTNNKWPGFSTDETYAAHFGL